MTENSPSLNLPYIQPSQAQKHVTHNEAIRLLDAVVQLSVLSRDLTAPPAAPAEGDRHIVATGATGLWAGWSLSVALWVDGAWLKLAPREGWVAWVAAEQALVVWDGTVWGAVSAGGSGGGGGATSFSDAAFGLTNAGDPTKQALFELGAISTGTTRSFALPDTSGEVAVLTGAQTFSGDKTFAGTLTVSASAAAIGTASTTASYGVGTGATASGVTKTVNLGTAGLAGSNTVVNLGSAVAGALGTTVVNTPTVTFANSVTQVGMPQANLTVQQVGLGGAVADSYNRLSANTPAVLLNHAGNGIEVTFNKNASANDASFAFKTGYSTRTLLGLLGDDDFSVKVSPDGAVYREAMKIDRSTGRVALGEPLLLAGQSVVPTPPPAGKLALYARDRAGSGWLDVQRPSGRFFPLQPHFGVNRIATWAPSTSTTVNTNGMPRTAIGTVATPTLATTSLSTSIRRWRVSSAATVDAVADERAAAWVCWRGNAAGLGGWSYVNRLSLVTLQATGMGFFGLYGSTAALPVTQTLAAAVNCVGIGFQRGTHANWQVVRNDATGAPTLTDLGSSFAVDSTANVLSLYIAASPNGADIGLRVVEEVSGSVAEFVLNTDIPAATQLLSPRNFMNTGATAAAVAYDCSGVYIETDF